MSSAELAFDTVGTVGAARNAIGSALTVVGGAYRLSGLTTFDRSQLDTARRSLESWYASIKLLSGNVGYVEEFQAQRYRITLALKLVKGIADVTKLRDEASWTSFVTGLPAGFAEALGYTLRSTLNAVGAGAGAIGGGLVSGLGIVGTLVVVAVIWFVYFRGATA